MPVVSAILALLVGAAGWHYLFHSRSASGLAEFESPELNRKRVRLRRANGVVMILLAGCFLLLAWLTTRDPSAPVFLAVLGTLLFLLLAAVVLAMIDFRLTIRLRPRHRRED